MNFRHPVFLIILTATIFVLIGIYLVERQRAVSPTGGSGTWGSINAYLDTPEPVRVSNEVTVPEDTIANENPAVLSIPSSATSTPAKKTSTSQDPLFDYNALLAELRKSTSKSSAQQAQSTYNELVDAFGTAPAIQAPSAKKRTPVQEALFAYGNAVGSKIQGFAAVNPNMTQTLTDQITHRNDPSKGGRVRDLGDRYKALGESILAIEDVPTAAEQAHKTLGDSYVHLGEALAKVPDATEDQAFIAAITTYNNKADAFTNAFVGMVTLFSMENVVFESTDSGSVFTFRRN